MRRVTVLPGVCGRVSAHDSRREYSGVSMGAALSLVTFEDLVEKITEFHDRARAGESRVGWKKLLEVAIGLAGGTNVEDDPSASGAWYMTGIRVKGYQGIGDGPFLAIDLDPTPGITVIHGANGSGKSSIADAIETALQGRIREPALDGRGGNEPIWEREHCGRDAQEAIVELTLRSGSDTLVIQCCLDQSGQTTRWTARRIAGGTELDIDLSETGWMSAVSGYRPVFSYAVVEREVQLARNLQQFLERLLAFGSCLDALSQEIERRSRSAVEARERWDAALRSAQIHVDQVDGDRAREGRTQLPAVVWPAVSEDPDDWLRRSELTETGVALPEVRASALDELREIAAAVVRELAQLRESETSLHAQLAGPLKDLHAEAVALDDAGEVCPVCATAGVSWLDRLTESVNDLVEIQTIQERCRGAIGNLRTSAINLLGTVAGVLAARQDEKDKPEWWRTTIVRFLDEAEQAGGRITADLRTSASAASTWIGSPDCEQVVRAAAAESDHLRQWRHARRDAINSFISEWRSTAADASQASVWSSANAQLARLRNSLRTERATVLGTQTNLKVQALLADVGITLKSIRVQGRQASLRVVDQQDRDLQLSMLSAGQRNALLLAPMLAVSDGGPFRFLVLDDPVHAFDQVRVDRLAAAISDVARSRRVVVLTHDERLKEHLIARDPNCDVRGVARDASTGAVTSVVQGEMWEVLLEDALGVLDTVETQPQGVTRLPYDIVRGLCRQAFDNALRSLVLRSAVRQSRDPDQDLRELDSEDRTRARIQRARQIVAPIPFATTAVDDAEQLIASYLGGWNRASHGNPPIGAHDIHSLRAEIRVARQACERITAI